MPDLAARAEQIAIAIHRLDEDPGRLRMVEWSAKAIEMLLGAEDLGVDADLTLAASWASAAIGAGCWLHDGPGYELDDVRKDLGDEVARIVMWTVQEEWQSMDGHLSELIETGPIEARIVVLAQTIARCISGSGPTERQAERAMRLAMSIPDLAVRVATAGWPGVVVDGVA